MSKVLSELIDDLKEKRGVWSLPVGKNSEILMKNKEDILDFFTNYWNGINSDFFKSLDRFRIMKKIKWNISFNEFINIYQEDKIRAIYFELFLEYPPPNRKSVLQSIESKIKFGDSVENLFKLVKLNPSLKSRYFLREIKKENTFLASLKSFEDFLRESENITINFIDTNTYKIEHDVTEVDLLAYLNHKDNNQKAKKVTIERLVRNSPMAKDIKNKYQQCQLCRIKLKDSNNGYITEAHHIKPYNKKHLGDDNLRNLIVLCPNCHAQFDDLYYAINPETKKIHCINEDDERHLSDLYFLEDHILGEEYLLYIWNLFTHKRQSIG
jgi:hypothetical protein